MLSKFLKNKKVVVAVAALTVFCVIFFIAEFHARANQPANTYKEVESSKKVSLEEESSSVSAEIRNSNSPYLIKVNRILNCVTVYSKDSDGDYTVPVKAMVCSTGRDTPIGTFKTSDKYTWRKLVGNVWGQYAYRITGDILFHSVPYFTKNKGNLETDEFNKLGEKASLGCIRLQVADAKWLIDNCPKKTFVIIYDDPENPGPLGKPVAPTIPASMKWDPTDPDYGKVEKADIQIHGANNLSFEAGAEPVNLLNGITAFDGNGRDITASITVSGSVDFAKAGDYPISFTCTDTSGNQAVANIIVTIKDTTAPVINAFSDTIIVNADNVTDIKSFLLGQVTVTDINLMSVSVAPEGSGITSFSEFVPGNSYQVTYTAVDYYNNISTKTITVVYSVGETPSNTTDTTSATN